MQLIASSRRMRPEIKLHKPTVKKLLLTICTKPIRGVSFAAWLEQECFRVLGKDEMVTRGSRWRKRIAENPEKTERVIADVRAMHKEGMHIRNPGAYAEDLWKRFV